MRNTLLLLVGLVGLAFTWTARGAAPSVQVVTINIATLPHDGDYLGLGGSAWNWRTNVTAPSREILIGSSKADCALNLFRSLGAFPVANVTLSGPLDPVFEPYDPTKFTAIKVYGNPGVTVSYDQAGGTWAAFSSSSSSTAPAYSIRVPMAAAEATDPQRVMLASQLVSDLSTYATNWIGFQNNTAANVGTGFGVYDSAAGTELDFKSLAAVAPILIDSTSSLHTLTFSIAANAATAAGVVASPAAGPNLTWSTDGQGNPAWRTPAPNTIGLAWTLQSTPADLNWTAVTYGNGLWVAVAAQGTTGASNAIMTSADGLTWTQANAPGILHVSWRTVAYGNGLFVVTGTRTPGYAGTQNTHSLTSPDGVTWTDHDMGLKVDVDQLAFGNGLFVGSNWNTDDPSNVVTSPDGITWTGRTAPGTASGWDAIAYSPSLGLFAAVANMNNAGFRVITSPDGLTWTTRATPATWNWYLIAWGNGKFLAMGNDNAGNGATMTSADGLTWTASTNAPAPNPAALAFGDGIFAATFWSAPAGGHAVAISRDGLTWSLEPTPADNTWDGLAFGAGQFVAVGETGTGQRVMTSLNPLPFNSAVSDGIVTGSSGQALKAWSTDSAGKPAWRTYYAPNELLGPVGGTNRTLVVASGTTGTNLAGTVVTVDLTGNLATPGSVSAASAATGSLSVTNGATAGSLVLTNAASNASLTIAGTGNLIVSTNTTPGDMPLKVMNNGANTVGITYAGAFFKTAGTGGTGIALYADATGGTSNYALKCNNGDVWINGGKLIESTSAPPASAGATGVQGTIAWDANYIYICTSANTWKRAALSSW